MKYSVSVKLHKDFIEVNGNFITVGVMAKPQNGKANQEIIKKIAEYRNIPQSRVRIVAGKTSKKKIVEIV